MNLSLLLLVTLNLQLMGQGGSDGGSLKSVRDKVYSAAQAKRGERLYGRSCSHCHQPRAFVGPAYMDSWTDQTAGDLFELIRNTMPEDNPGSLRRREYAAILAYLFSLNAMPAGDSELKNDPQSLQRIRIEGPYGQSGGPAQQKSPPAIRADTQPAAGHDGPNPSRSTRKLSETTGRVVFRSVRRKQ